MPISFDIKKGLQGIIATGIPFIFKGLINEWLTQQHIDIPKACELVLSGKDLITLFREYGADFDNVLHRAGGFVQDPSWLTSDWLIDAIRDEHPDLASLFMGWDEGRSWLDMQTENFRNAFIQANSPAPVKKPLPKEPPEQKPEIEPQSQLKKEEKPPEEPQILSRLV